MEFVGCTLKTLPQDQWVAAASVATRINPANAPLEVGFSLMGGVPPTPLHIAAITQKYWGSAGAKLSVGFLDNPEPDVKRRLLECANSWAGDGWANVEFVEASARTAQVRILREPSKGYYSYLGTDILSIPEGEPTMNLASWTASIPDSEWLRVPPHEFGHTLAFPHEHAREEIVRRIDVERAVAKFMRTQGWSRETVIAQVITSLRESSLMSTPPDVDSIMCYQLDGDIMIDGIPVPGGLRLNASDLAFCARIYPGTGQPPEPPEPPPKPPPVSDITFTLPAGTYRIVPASGVPGVSGVLQIGGEVAGTLAAEEQVDSYPLAVERGAYVLETHGPTDVKLELYGPNTESALLASNDDGGVVANAKIAVELVAGRYWLKVSMARFHSSEVGSYRLSAKRGTQ